jgi:hypothetical protein
LSIQFNVDAVRQRFALRDKEFKKRYHRYIGLPSFPDKTRAPSQKSFRMFVRDDDSCAVSEEDQSQVGVLQHIS